jgi:glutathione synthase/RimK-type ligase-like ATP-grasp enzyme
MERRDEFLQWARSTSEKTRFFNPFEVVRWNTHKSYLRDLADRGVPTLPTRWLDAGSAVDVASILQEEGWRRGFLKPAVGATARETLRFDDDASGVTLATAHLARVLPHEDMMLQPYQETVESQGEFSLLVIDGEVTHAVRKVPVPGDYRVQDDFGAHDEPFLPSGDEVRLALAIVRAAASANGLSSERELLYARADFLRDREQQLRLIELELVEPSLFFRHSPVAADRLANGLLSRVAASSPLAHAESSG